MKENWGGVARMFLAMRALVMKFSTRGTNEYSSFGTLVYQIAIEL